MITRTIEKKIFVALVDRFDQLEARDYQNPNIKITIAVLGEKGAPRNWSRGPVGAEPANSTGGMFCRLWAYKSSTENVSVMFSCYGPEITFGDQSDYEHAARACKLVNARLHKTYQTRGNPLDEADHLGRWLEACGVSTVFIRPADDHHTWLNEGEWEQWTIGRTIQEARAKFPKTA